MSKNRELHIAYIGRLEREKGIDYLIEAIERATRSERNIVWHICGDGSYGQILQQLASPQVVLHGYVDPSKMQEILASIDLVFMPSLFLETFGLVALEVITLGVPVSGFSRGGLIPFIHSDLILDEGHPVDSFFEILERGNFPLMDVSDFSYERWISRLVELTDGQERILLVTDYAQKIGGVEEYIEGLTSALRSIGKTVETVSYEGSINKWKRIWLMFMAPFAFWRRARVEKKIQQFSPDLIWMHSVLRYIGPHGIWAIYRSSVPVYLTHHDLGLITPRPSRLYRELDIPQSAHLGDWVPRQIDLFSLLGVLGKWIYIRSMWSILDRGRFTHIVPSAWMGRHIQIYTRGSPLVFPHTTQIPSHP